MSMCMRSAKGVFPAPPRSVRYGRCAACAATYVYRQGRQEDSSEIRRLIISQFMNPLGLDPERFRVAVTEQNDIAGFGQLVPHNEMIGELRSLFVQEEHRKAGIGTELVKQLVSNRDTPQVWLVTPSYRTAFYERAGFRAVPPWQVPGTMKVDIVLGAAVLAVVARSGIAGMTLRETMSSTDEA